MQEDSRLKENTRLNISREVLRDYFSYKEEITPELSTNSMEKEIDLDGTCLKTIEYLMKQEKAMQFQNVAQEFKVIDSNTVTVVVAEAFAKLQKKSVAISRTKIRQWHLKEIADDVFQWSMGYDEFLGYMRGVLDR